jgi:hypothetical protein
MSYKYIRQFGVVQLEGINPPRKKSKTFAKTAKVFLLDEGIDEKNN